ncbi:MULTISPECIES: helix-turn-helix domain containing protein [unclassified Clostridioides]|uniref:helix-turn-helix domain containing protein n=1 Tax=unclassified Clostridioides TaxID=2635829 RepID=UPI001D12222D|nr:helix-turn-helix domain containing protein [Clostridioides sp. ES-S-0049-03]MCC0678215.1 helix-turn-helix domain containing protein [Clostridioides sp. ES-W-0018-02]MCC0713043.1 helix-turn-helix domain containing protein [Clostridioides sp. ES-W-0017-02]
MSIKYNDKRVVLVDFEDVDKLNDSKVRYIDLEDKQYYVVSQGKRPKKFTDADIKSIKEDLDNGMSLKEAETKYRCSKNTIIKIKRKNY